MLDKIKISELPEVAGIIKRDYLVVNVEDKVSSKLSFASFLDSLTSQNLVWTGNLVFEGSVSLPEGTEQDPLFVASPAFTITNDDITRWNQAYSWGDHALEGYLKQVDLPTDYLVAGDNISLLNNDVPYITEAEVNQIIDGLDFITLNDLELILNGGGVGGKYLQAGDPVSLLKNDVPYLTEANVINLLDGLTINGQPNPGSGGYLKRAVAGVPQDNVSELFNDVPYLTQSDYVQLIKEYLKRKDADGNPQDVVSELENDVGYLTHEYDGDPLVGYDLEVLSNTRLETAVEGSSIAKQGDEWVPYEPISVSSLTFKGCVDLKFAPTEAFEPGDIIVQRDPFENDIYPDPAWTINNLHASGQVKDNDYLIAKIDGSWDIAGQWNDYLQADFNQTATCHPAYIKNRPEKLSDIDPSLPDHIGNGSINVNGGDGIVVTGTAGTANQETDSHQTVAVDPLPDGGILVDNSTRQIYVDWQTFVGEGDIILEGDFNIEVKHLTAQEPNANQFCESRTVIQMTQAFLDRIGALETSLADALARIRALEGRP